MTFIGDLERLFATSLYPLRIPILVGLLVLAIVLAVLAVKGRWHQVAARHHLVTGIAIAVVIAVGLPAAWYLGSPLFLSSTLEEPGPVAAGATRAPSAASSDAPPRAGSTDPGSTPSVAPPSAAAAPGGSATPAERSGTFTGADEFHFGSGTARIIVAADGSAVLRFEDFAVRNGPDLFVYLSPKGTGYSAAATELGRLKADKGSFNYTIPTGTDLGKVKSVVIWCKQFAVQFAVAPLG